MRQYFELTDYQHLYIERNSRIYYARIDRRINGKLTAQRCSLKTKVLTEALVKLASFLAESGKQVGCTMERMSWVAIVDLWLQKETLRPELKPRALEAKRYFSNRVRNIFTQDVAIDAITPEICRLWWSRHARSASARTVNGTLTTAKAVLDYAVEQGIIKTSPMSGLKPMRLEVKKLNIPSREDLNAILADIRNARAGRGYKSTVALYSASADMIEFLASSGLRIEEARRLTWGDITDDMISVPDIKHAQNRRIIYINIRLKEVIASIREHAKDTTSGASVFSIDSPRRTLSRACQRLGLPHVRIHDLRHYFATSCIESGVDIPTVARWLGHRDGGALAMKVYGHLRDEHSREQTKRIVL